MVDDDEESQKSWRVRKRGEEKDSATVGARSRSLFYGPKEQTMIELAFLLPLKDAQRPPRHFLRLFLIPHLLSSLILFFLLYFAVCSGSSNRKERQCGERKRDIEKLKARVDLKRIPAIKRHKENFCDCDSSSLYSLSRFSSS